MTALTKLVEATDVAVVLFESARLQRIIAYSFTVAGVVVAIATVVYAPSPQRNFKTLAPMVLVTIGFFMVCTLAVMVTAVDEVMWRADRMQGTLVQTRTHLWSRVKTYPLRDAANLRMLFLAGGDDNGDTWVVQVDFPERKNVQVAQVLKKPDAEAIYSALSRVMPSASRAGAR